MKTRNLTLPFIITCCTIFITFSCGQRYSGEWVAKIDSNTITIDELNTFYYAQQKSLYNLPEEKIDEIAADPEQLAKNPTLSKNEFLEQLIRQRLVYKKAVEEGMLKKNELNALIKMAEEAVVVGFYVREKFKDEIEPTDEEISRVYNNQRARFRGVPIDQATNFIKQQLEQQNLQKKIRELVDNLREAKKIEKNMDLLKKLKSKKTSNEEEAEKKEK